MGIAASFWPFGGKGDSAAPDWRRRFRAWWEGYELAPPQHAQSGSRRAAEPVGDAASAASEDAARSPVDLSVPEPEAVWSEARRRLVQILWGEGYIWPGGEDYAFDLSNVFALTAKVSMLEVGAGMCGASRAVVSKFGTYVTALERSHDLVQVGRAQNVSAAMDDKIKLDYFDPTNLGLKEKYFEAALVRDSLFTVENKSDVLAEIIRSLKPEGQITLTDLFFDDGDGDDALSDWRACELETVHPWSVDVVKRAFAENNVVLRIAEDQTSDYRAMALATWDDFPYKIKQGAVPSELTGTMLREAEMWARRMTAMESGALKYYRFLGIKNH